MYDIVYFVKDTKHNEELRYSLRTLVNFPHRKVWFYGGCPEGLKPDQHVYVKQDRENKWLNINKSITQAVENPDITNNFWLFNDDFFIMKPVKKQYNYYDGDLYKRIVTLEDRFGRFTKYSLQLRKICDDLISMGCDVRNFCIHVPMLVNKEKAKEVLAIEDSHMFRSLYGNYHNIDAKQLSDYKISNPKLRWKDSVYLSTTEHSFDAEVGKQIRELFPDKCKYEK